jgi:hypothetical protein
MRVISRPCMTLLPGYNNNLIGSIPTEIGLLTTITFLGFCKSKDNFSFLTKLASNKPHNLVISRSCSILLPAQNYLLTGTIPTEIGLLTSLVSIHLCKSIDRFSRFDFGFYLFRYYCTLPKPAWKPNHLVVTFVHARYCYQIRILF